MTSKNLKFRPGNEIFGGILGERREKVSFLRIPETPKGFPWFAENNFRLPFCNTWTVPDSGLRNPGKKHYYPGMVPKNLWLNIHDAKINGIISDINYPNPNPQQNISPGSPRPNKVAGL